MEEAEEGDTSHLEVVAAADTIHQEVAEDVVEATVVAVEVD